MTRRYFVLFMIALLMAVGAAWIANRWIQSKTAPLPMQAAMQTAKVIVAAQDLPFGHKIEATNLTTADWPQSTLPKGIFSNQDEVIGKITQRSFQIGEPLLASRLSDHLGGSTLSALIEPQKRAISVRVNDVVGVAGFVLPGNWVDVLATRKVNNEVVRTITLLHDVRVLAVDQEASPEKEKPTIVRAVTLELTPAQAEKLVNAANEGDIQLTLRNPVDHEIIAEEAPKPKPQVRPVVRRSIEIIRGLQRAHSS
jgi:pilus assembly protein CpaB